MIAERPHSIAVVGGPSLEGALAVPPAARAGVVVCHPHPLYGGDMDNPVVLAATHERALEVVPLQLLQAYAADIPDDPRSLL